ncbi:hypothetical protein ACLOAV_008354 [Pseudogymnoascus australis]
MPPRNMEKFSLRPIIPSSADNSTLSNPSQSTSESTSWNLRQKHRNDNAGGLSTSHSNRQSVFKSATKNACLNCKKARAKVRKFSQILSSTHRCPLSRLQQRLEF